MAPCPWITTFQSMIRWNEVSCYFGLIQNLDKTISVRHFDVGKGLGVHFLVLCNDLIQIKQVCREGVNFGSRSGCRVAAWAWSGG